MNHLFVLISLYVLVYGANAFCISSYADCEFGDKYVACVCRTGYIGNGAQCRVDDLADRINYIVDSLQSTDINPDLSTAVKSALDSETDIMSDNEKEKTLAPLVNDLLNQLTLAPLSNQLTLAPLSNQFPLAPLSNQLNQNDDLVNQLLLEPLSSHSSIGAMVYEPKDNYYHFKVSQSALIVIGGLIGCVLIINIVLLWRANCYGKKKVDIYRKVGFVDTDVDSEANIVS
eukprot:537920_1